MMDPSSAVAAETPEQKESEMAKTIPGVLPQLCEPYRWEHNRAERQWEILEGDEGLLRWYISEEFLTDATEAGVDAVIVRGTRRFQPPAGDAGEIASRSGEHGPEGATGSADPSGPTTAEADR